MIEAACSGEAAWLLLRRGRAALERGEVAAAEAAARDVAGVDATGRRWEALAHSAGLLAECAARRGDVRAGEQFLGQVLAPGVADPRRWRDVADPWYRALHALVQVGLEPARVRALLDTTPAYPTGRVAIDPALPHHVAGALAESERRFDDAVEAYDAALVGTGRHRSPSLEADALTGRARALVKLGRTDEARADVAAARDLLARWTGWRVDELDAVAAALDAAAGTPGAPAAAGGLTPRELEVAALVAEGLSNGEIAKRLYISTKTASVHVSNILTKLAMASRAEIAAWAVREGLAG